MNFLIIEFEKKDSKEDPLLRSIRVLDEEMTLMLLFLTYQIDVLETLTGKKYNSGTTITELDKLIKIVNNGKEISSNTKYYELTYEIKDTDMGEVQIPSIKVSLINKN